MKSRLNILVAAVVLGIGLAAMVVLGARAASADIPALSAAGDPAALGLAAPGGAGGLIARPSAPRLISSTSLTTLVEAGNGDLSTLDPALDYETTGGEVLEQIYDTLVTYPRERSDVVVPMLALTWTVSGDEKTYTFHIRPGVTFHNGDSLTPDDVAYSLQRGLLQGGTSSPQWLFAEPFLGANVFDIAEVVNSSGALDDNRAALQAADPAKLLAACQQVTTAITADDGAFAVTLHLAQPWSPLLVTLATQFGSIMDRSWSIQHGGWDGNCADWQNFYAPTPGTDPFTSITNGTGPYLLDHWTPGSEVVLLANPNYWVSAPLWPGGPAGPAALQRVEIKNVSDETTQVNMLLSGAADLGSLVSQSNTLLSNYVLLNYAQPDGVTGTLHYLTGTLRSYSGGLGASAQDAFFNYSIVTDTSQYIGSGTFDGHGIPSDFFTDLHIRKAFNYAFNWTQYITDVYAGAAIQHRGPIIKGIEGYTDTQPVYFYSPTLALQQFNLAWGGQVATHGFSMTLSYNQGNFGRQRTLELLKAGIEVLNPNFHVNVIELPFPTWAADYQSRRLPIGGYSWLEDIAHPHNWVVPYLIGTFANRQSLPSDQRSIFQTKINNCLALAGSAAESCYEDIQNTTYLSATDIFLAQAYVKHFVRAEVRGSYLNLATSGPYFYALSKGPLPVAQPVVPGNSQAVNFTSSQGPTGTLLVPAGAVTQSLSMVVVPDTLAHGPAGNFQLGNLAFDIQAYDGAGALISGQTFSNPVTLTVHYNSQSLGTVIESSLSLFYWNGASWVDAACGPYMRDPVHQVIQVPLCHLSQFALAGATHRLFFPLARH